MLYYTTTTTTTTNFVVIIIIIIIYNPTNCHLILATIMTVVLESY